MTIEPIIFFDMAATIFILAVALIMVIKKHHGQHGADEAFKKNTDLLDEARQKALNLIDEANNKALDIINKASLSTDIASSNFNQKIADISSLQIKQFEKITSDFTKLYNQVLSDLKTKNIEVFQNVSKDIEVSTMGEIKNFKDSMEKLTISSEKLVKKKIDTDYEVTKKEIEAYKEGEIKKIDLEIYKLLEKTSKLVIGRAINLSEHEDLVLDSLEKAKKEGIFK